MIYGRRNLNRFKGEWFEMTTKDRRFIVDAGHGGRYDGAVAKPLFGLIRKEKDITLKVAQRLVSKLRTDGGAVWPTRTIDKDFNGTTLEDDINKRVIYINTLPAVDYLVSIHVNTNLSIGNVGVYCQPGSVASKGLAQVVAVATKTAWFEKDLAILRDTKKASHKILIEIGEITDDRLDDENYLNTFVDSIVKGLFAHNIA